MLYSERLGAPWLTGLPCRGVGEVPCLRHCNKRCISHVLRTSYKNVTVIHLISSLWESSLRSPAAEPTWTPLINHEPSNWSLACSAYGLSHQDSTCGTLSIVPSVLHWARQDIVWTSLLLQLQKPNNAACYYPLALDLLFPDCLMNVKLTKLTSVTLLLHSHGAGSPEIENKVTNEICTLLGFEAA
jgi:hypothetical protein